MRKVEDLRVGWEQEHAAMKAATEKKTKKNKLAPDPEDDGMVPDEDPAPSTANLFEDSDEDSDYGVGKGQEQSKRDEDSDKARNDEMAPTAPAAEKTTQEDLFGDSSDDESDEELVRSSSKRNQDDGEEPQPAKKRKVAGEADNE